MVWKFQIDGFLDFRYSKKPSTTGNTPVSSTDYLSTLYVPNFVIAELLKGFSSEIDIVLDEYVLRAVIEGSNPTDPQLRVLRTVTKGSLDYLTYASLRDVVSRRLQSWGRLTAEQLGHYRIKCLRKDNTLCEISEDFPEDTDLGWREFFAGVFYVDFH